MRVLLLADSLPNGGAERQLALLAGSLPVEWEPRVWAMDEGPYHRYLLDLGIPVVAQPRRFRFDPLPAAMLWHELRSWRPDVVHSWGWMAALAAGPVCRLLRVPCVNGMIRTGTRRNEFACPKRLGIASATLVAANSHAGLQAWGIGPARGRTVYNGFDWTRLGSLEDRPPKDGSTFTVIMTGRMTAVKHFDVVIEAARRLSAVSDDWRFLLVGDGPDRRRLMGRAADLVESGVVVFPEPGMEVLGLVGQSDVGVLMTNPNLATEGLSNSIMEYMALGLPVICGDGGGNPELVLDRVTGFIVAPADVDGLADRLTCLRADPALCHAMGASGRDRIRSEFSVERMVQSTLRVYAEAIEMTRSPLSW